MSVRVAIAGCTSKDGVDRHWLFCIDRQLGKRLHTAWE